MRVASSSKTAMNSAPMLLRFFSGSVTPASFARKRCAGVDGDDVEAELVAQVLLHVLELVFAQHAVVDEDAGELGADGLVHQHGGDRGIDAAGEPADDVAARRPSARIGATVVSMKCAGVQSPLRAADIEDEVADELAAERRVVHLGMELHGPDAALVVGDAGQGVRGDGGAVKAGGKFERLRRRGSSRRARVGGRPAKSGVAASSMVTSAWPYSRLGAGAHLAAEVMDDEVEAVADAEDGHAEFEHAWGRRRARPRRRPTTARRRG